MKNRVFNETFWTQENIPVDLKLPDDWKDYFFSLDENRIGQRLGNDYNEIILKADELIQSIKLNNQKILSCENKLSVFNKIVNNNVKFFESVKITNIMSVEGYQRNMQDELKRTNSLFNKAQFNITENKERTQREIDGIFQALFQIYNNNLNVNSETISQLHYSYYPSEIRKENEQVALVKNFNSQGKIIVSVSPIGWYVKDYLDMLCNSLNSWCNWNDLSALNIIRIFIFIYDFLAIHPFSNGNGRMSRLLIIWLCKKLGIKCVNYSSIEGIIYNSRDEYNQVINQSMENWWTEYSPIQSNFFDYCFYILQKSIIQLNTIIDEINSDNKLLNVVEVIKTMDIQFTPSQLLTKINLSSQQLDKIIFILNQCNIVKKLSDGTIFKYGGVYENS